MLGDGHDDYLHRRNAGRQHQAVVVPVHHDNSADHPGGNAPAGLIGGLEGVVPAGEGNAEALGEAVAKIVAVPPWRATPLCIMASMV